MGEWTGDLRGNTSYCGQPVHDWGWWGQGRFCTLVFAKLEESHRAGACGEETWQFGLAMAEDRERGNSDYLVKRGKGHCATASRFRLLSIFQYVSSHFSLT